MSIFNKRYTSLDQENYLAKNLKNLGKTILSFTVFSTLNSLRKNKAIDLTTPENMDKWKELTDFSASNTSMAKRVKIALVLACLFVGIYSIWFFLFFLDYNIFLKTFLFLSVTALTFFLINNQIKFYTPLTKDCLNKYKDLFPELLTDESKKEN